MPTTKKKTASKPATLSERSATVASPPVLPTDPPDVTLPAVPAGFVPVNLKLYRGSFPRVGQIAAMPGAIIELSNSASYEATFGPTAPSASQLVAEFTVASQWTAMRIRIEAFLVFVRSNEAITWKTSLSDIETLSALYQLFAKQNPTVVAGFPELGKLLEVRSVISKVGAASRARNAKQKAAKAASAAAVPSPSVAAASVVTPVTSSGTGGVVH